MNKKQLQHLIGFNVSTFFVLFSFVVLAACSGGGADRGDDAEAETGVENVSNTLTGQFADGLVSGLHFKTDTQSGVTNDNGEFLYLEGETVTFSVGDIVIGTSAGAPTITPFDLSEVIPPLTGTEVRKAWNQIIRLKRTTPLEIAANIAVFLQTLDDDGRADTGIEIPSSMHGIAEGKTLDFNQTKEEFVQDISFRKLMTEGRDAGLWGGSRAIRKSLYALDTLYEGLNLKPVIKGVSAVESDDNGDGNVNSRDTITYNDKGEVTVWELDNDGNDTVDWRRTIAFDENGNLTLTDQDDNGDGTINLRQNVTLDSNGNQILVEQDESVDGTIDFRQTRTVDVNGYLTLFEEDKDGDGFVDRRQILTRDTKGNITVFEEDHNGDGTIDLREFRTFDVDNNMTLIKVDTNGDGIVNFRDTFFYDTNGNLILRERDNGNDGTIDKREFRAFDVSNNMTLLEVDTNGDDTVNFRETFAYDANGSLTLRERDSDNNGAIDFRQTRFYDDESKLIRFEDDTDGDGIVDHIHKFSYTPVNRWVALIISSSIH